MTPTPNTTSAATHTAGPWRIVDVTIGKLHEPAILAGGDIGTKICTLPALSTAGGSINIRAAQIAADARLIAAAPDLLAALRRLTDAADIFAADQSGAKDDRCGLVQPISVAEGNEFNAAIMQARAAIDKAEGR